MAGHQQEQHSQPHMNAVNTTKSEVEIEPCLNLKSAQCNANKSLD